MAIRRFNGNEVGNVAGGAKLIGKTSASGGHLLLRNAAEKNAYIQYLRTNYTDEDAAANGMSREAFIDDYRKVVFANPNATAWIPISSDEYEEFKQFCEEKPIFGAGVRFEN